MVHETDQVAAAAVQHEASEPAAPAAPAEPSATPAPAPPTEPGAPAQPPVAQPAPPAPAPASTKNLMDDSLEAEVEAALSSMSNEELNALSGPGPGGANEGDENVIAATVVSIHGDDVFIDAGGRAEGVVPASQFESLPALGSKVEVVPDRYDPDSSMMVYSREGAVQKANWDRLERGTIIEGRCTGMVKGGLELDVNGIRAFMPASQCDVIRLTDVSVLIGEKLQAIVTEVDPRDKNLVVSRRKLQEKLRKASRDQLLDELEVGQIRKGVVANVTDYGAFIDLGGVDGLVHVSDMSYARVNKPSDVLQTGQEVEVKVLKYDRESKKISLGLKQIQPDPWDAVAVKYTEGMQLTVRVVRLADFGAFAAIEDGIDALIPVSEMSWTERVNKPSDVLSVGQEVNASVLRIDTEKRRMSLSLKRLQEDPWSGVESQYPANAVVRGKVARITDFGAFVELHPGVDGLIHISELSEHRVRNVSEIVKEGQEVECRVISSDANGRKISLSMKNVHEAAAPTSMDQLPDRPEKKRKKPLRGGLESGGDWFIG